MAVPGKADSGDFFWVDEDGKFEFAEGVTFEWLEQEGYIIKEDTFYKGE